MILINIHHHKMNNKIIIAIIVVVICILFYVIYRSSSKNKSLTTLLQEEKSAHESAISALNTEKEVLNNTITKYTNDCVADITTKEARIAELENKVRQRESEIVELTELSKVKLANLQSALDTETTNHLSLQQLHSAHLKESQAKISELTTEIIKYENDIAAIIETHNAIVTALKSELAAEKAALNSIIDTQKAEITAIKAQVQALEGDVEQCKSHHEQKIAEIKSKYYIEATFKNPEVKALFDATILISNNLNKKYTPMLKDDAESSVRAIARHIVDSLNNDNKAFRVSPPLYGDYSGHHILKTTADSDISCGDICGNNPECVLSVYDSSNNDCWLQSDIGKYSEDTKYITHLVARHICHKNTFKVYSYVFKRIILDELIAIPTIKDDVQANKESLIIIIGSLLSMVKALLDYVCVDGVISQDKVDDVITRHIDIIDKVDPAVIEYVTRLVPTIMLSNIDKVLTDIKSNA